MRLAKLALPALVMSVLATAPAAHAFSVESNGQGSGGSAQFSDPDERFDKLTDPGANLGGSGGATDRSTPTLTFSGNRQNPYPYRVAPPDPPAALHPGSDHLYWGNNPRRGQY